MSRIPTVYYNQNSNKVLVDGTLNAKIFVEGLEANATDIKQIKATDIDKVEVINNPSSVYGVDFLGAVINIVTKKTTKQFLKSALEISGGARNNSFSIFPNISFQKGFFYVKTDFQYSQNDLITSTDLYRTDFNGTLFQNTQDNSKLIQKSLNTCIGINFSKKLFLTFKEYYGGYQIKGNTNGNSITNDVVYDVFSNFNVTKHDESETSTVLKFKKASNKTFYFKHLFTLEKDAYYGEYKNATTNIIDIQSQNKSNSLNMSYNITDINLFKTPITLIYDLKYINRIYSFTNNDFFLNQNLYDATIDFSSEWTKNFSSQTSFTMEHSTNKNNTLSKNYNQLLPTINILYHFAKKVDASIGFSRRILRPSPGDLNDALIISSPGIAFQGNSKLEQKIRNYYSVGINKSFASDEVSLKFFNESINNLITDIYKYQDVLLIRTFENVGKFNSTGFNFSYSTKILKKIYMNLNSGLKYDIYESNDLTSVIKKNSGINFNGTLNLDANFFKNKLSVSLSGFQSGPNYTLQSKRVTYPNFDLSVSTNIFKNKFKLRFSADNFLGNRYSGINDNSQSDNFRQTFYSRNTVSNFNLALTYNFGKYFEDIEDNKIQNDDIRK